MLIHGFYRLNRPVGEYPAPIFKEPRRMIVVFQTDILQKNKDGTYTKLGEHFVSGVFIPLEHIEKIDNSKEK